MSADSPADRTDTGSDKGATRGATVGKDAGPAATSPRPASVHSRGTARESTDIDGIGGGGGRAFTDPNAADRLGASVTAYLVTGPVLYAAIGGLADRWLGTGFLLPAGLLAGMAMSLYVVWLRYGKP